MNRNAEKLCPTAVVLAVLVYCCWPYAGGPRTDSLVEASAKSPSIAPSLLSPRLDAPHSRDPFRLTRDDEPDEHANRIAAAPTDSVDGSEDEPGESLGPNESEPEPPPLPPLALNATIIRDDYRAAVINGQLYGVGDAVSEPGDSAAPVVVCDIQPHKVVLSGRKQQLELEYSSTAFHGSMRTAPAKRGASHPNPAPERTTTARQRAGHSSPSAAEDAP